MIHFTKYAENKFEILNKYGVFLTREQVQDTVNDPERIRKKGKCLAARKDDLKVVFKKEGDTKKVITFYPVK